MGREDPAAPPPGGAAPAPRLGLPDLGFGVGLRAPHIAALAAGVTGVDWLEVITENFLGDRGYGRHALGRLAARYPLVFHGVSLSIGGSDPLNRAYLTALRDLADEFEPAWVSDHLCFTGHGGHVSHDLLPLPRTAAALDHVAGRVAAAQDLLGRPLVLENASAYIDFAGAQMSEAEFLTRLVERTGCGLLLDVNNLFVTTHNLGGDPARAVTDLPAAAIVQLHISGPSPCGPGLVDTHVGPVPREVWELYLVAQRHTGGVSTLLEWDTDIPAMPRLVAELDTARRLRAGDLDPAALPRFAWPAATEAAPAEAEAPPSNPVDFLLGAPA